MEKQPPTNDDATNPSQETVGRFDYPRNRPAYLKKLTILSDKSEEKRLDHLAVIPWDDPEYHISRDDERWILPSDFDIGASSWYQELPVERQIEIGMYRYAQTCKVGSEFEKALIKGIGQFVKRPSNTDEENRYARHEADEEVGHIKMFEEFVAQTGLDVRGAPEWFHHMARLAGPVAKYLPVSFWSAVLAGEEPIDRTQRQLIERAKHGAPMHPLIHDVMKLHVEEEARHISFAHTYLERHIDPRKTDKLNRIQHLAMTASYPVFMRVFAGVILRPSKQSLQDMGIPQEVAKEIWWDSDFGRNYLRDLFPSARREADKLQLRRSKLGRAAWRVLGIDEGNQN